MIRSATILNHFIKARRAPKRWKTRAELERWQEREVLAFLKDIVPKSKFYQNAFSDINYSEWRKLKSVDKSSMMASFTEINTVGIQKEEAFDLAIRAEQTRDFTSTLGGVTVGLSSGTSGNRGLFLVGQNESWAYAGTLLGKILPDLFRGGHKAALFLRSNSNLYQSTQNPFLKFRYFDLTQPLREHVASLNQFDPTLLVGPPSVLRMLAEERLAGDLRISPKRILSGAEVLEPLDQRFIEDGFQIRVDQIYQCTEGFLGVSCSHGTLHLNEDLMVIEREIVKSPDGRSDYFVPVITDFTRTSQPIIRYRLNDLLLPKKHPCPCGSIFIAIESVSGRCDDILYFGSKPVLPDFIRRALMLSSDKIEEYRVIQHEPGSIEVQLKCKEGERERCRNAVIAKIGELCVEFCLEKPALKFRPYETQEQGKKLRRIYRNLD